MSDSTRDRLVERAITLGPPQKIVDTLNAVREAAGVPVEFVARSYFSTLAIDRQLELMDTLARDVAPYV